MKKAALYARTANSDANALAAQLDALRAFAAGQGYEVAAEFALNGAANTCCSALELLVRSARRLGLDCIIAHNPSRLCREGRRFRSLAELCREHGVSLEFLEPWMAEPVALTCGLWEALAVGERSQGRRSE